MRHFPLYQCLILSSILYQLNAQLLNADRMRRQGSQGPNVNAGVHIPKAFTPPSYAPFYQRTVAKTTLQGGPIPAEPTTVEPTTVETTTVEPTTVEPTTVEPTTQSTAGEPSTLPTTVTEPTSTELPPPRTSSTGPVIQAPTTFETSTEKTDKPTQPIMTAGPPANTIQIGTVATRQARTGRPTIKRGLTNSPAGFTKVKPKPGPGSPPTNGNANGDDGIHFKPLKDEAQEKKRKDDQYKMKVLIYEVATSVVLLTTSLIAYIASYLAFKYAKEIRNPQDIWVKMNRQSKSKSVEKKKEKKAKKGKKAAKK